MEIRTLIVDDEMHSREELKYQLKDYPDLVLVGEAEDGDEALEKIKVFKPALVFLDIQMPGKNGLLVAKELVEEKEPPIIIFATAYDQHALEAFEVAALDYLLKPFSSERIKGTMNRVYRKFEQKDSAVEQIKDFIERLERRENKAMTRISAEENERIKILEPKEIACAFVEERTVFVQTEEKRYKTSYSLQELEEKLHRPPFFRCHRSYLVNLEWISEIHPWFNGAYQLVLKDSNQTKVPVSRLSVKELKELLDLN